MILELLYPRLAWVIGDVDIWPYPVWDLYPAFNRSITFEQLGMGVFDRIQCNIDIRIPLAQIVWAARIRTIHSVLSDWVQSL